jgi:hypothetical protein
MKKTNELALEARRAYYREWRKRNKDRVRKYNQDYWTRRAIREASRDDVKEGK